MVWTPSRTLRAAARKGPPPVHLWNPPFCGDLDMRIASDGTWFYLKTPIGRAALVKLFASVLKREGDKYFLVTPVEKCGIVVDDAPFLAVELKVEQGEHGQALHFRTNVDDWVACGRGHALRFEPRARDRRAQALSPRAARPLGEGDARACSTISSSWARSATSTADACSALPRRESSSPWRQPKACGILFDGRGSAERRDEQ